MTSESQDLIQSPTAPSEGREITRLAWTPGPWTGCAVGISTPADSVPVIGFAQRKPVEIEQLRCLFFTKTAAQVAYLALHFSGDEKDVEAVVRYKIAREHLHQNWIGAIRAFDEACAEFFGYRVEQEAAE